MKKFSSLWAALGLLLTGCVPLSIAPIYTAKDVVFDQKLAGSWGKEQKATMIFEKANDNGYKLTWHEDDDKTSTFDVRLVKLGDAMFLDFYPEAKAWEEMPTGAFYKISLLRTHFFFKVLKINEAEFQIAAIDLKWLANYLRANPNATPYRLVKFSENDDEELVVFTGSTEQIQEFIQKHLGNAAWEEGETMLRVDAKSL